AGDVGAQGAEALEGRAGCATADAGESGAGTVDVAAGACAAGSAADRAVGPDVRRSTAGLTGHRAGAGAVAAARTHDLADDHLEGAEGGRARPHRDADPVGGAGLEGDAVDGGRADAAVAGVVVAGRRDAGGTRGHLVAG